MSIIKFEVETEAAYDEAETEELLDAALAFFKGVDGDVVDGTESLEIVDSNSNSNSSEIDEDRKQEIIEEFLKNGDFEADIRIRAKGYASDGRFASGIASLDNE